MDITEKNLNKSIPSFQENTPVNFKQEGSNPLRLLTTLIKKNIKITLLLLVIVLFALLVLFVFNYLNKPGSRKETNSFVSDQDYKNQQIIKKISGNDWSNLPAKPNGSEKQSLAVLLLSFNEETSVLRPEVTATNLVLPTDISKHQLVKLNTDLTNANLQKLVDQLIALESIYKDKGLMPSSTHIARLQVIKNYFAKYLPQQKYKVPDSAKDISGGIVVAANQLDFAKVLISRYNNWFTYATLVK